MPTSHYTQIPEVLQAVLDAKPKTVLEVGIGCGKYGALLREYLTVWDHYFEPFDMNKVLIDGIEIHGLYATSPAWACYNSVFQLNAWDFFNLYPTAHYDLALMVDVLEHFEFEEGIALLRTLREHADVIVVAVPAGFVPTVEVWGNPHEIHRSGYSPEQLTEAGFQITMYRNADSFVMVLR